MRFPGDSVTHNCSKGGRSTQSQPSKAHNHGDRSILEVTLRGLATYPSALPRAHPFAGISSDIHLTLGQVPRQFPSLPALRIPPALPRHYPWTAAIVTVQRISR